jgi:hypothetical protein
LINFERELDNDVRRASPVYVTIVEDDNFPLRSKYTGSLRDAMLPVAKFIKIIISKIYKSPIVLHNSLYEELLEDLGGKDHMDK